MLGHVVLEVLYEEIIFEYVGVNIIMQYSCIQ